MRNLVFGVVVSVFCWLHPAPDLDRAWAGDPIIMFDPSDSAMNQAILDARETLGSFFEKLDSGEAERALLKVAVPYGEENAEHIWMTQLSIRDAGRLEATVANDPVHVTQIVKLGDRYAFTFDQISDWMYYRGDIIHGAYTIRVMLPRLPKEQADQLRAVLSPLPQ